MPHTRAQRSKAVRPGWARQGEERSTVAGKAPQESRDRNNSLEEAQEVVVLAVDVAADFDGRLELEQDRL